MRQFAPWVLAAIAIAAIFPAVKLQEQRKPDGSAEQEKARPAAEESPKEGEYPQAASNPCRPKEGKAEAPWCEPLRILRDFYGLEPVSASPAQEPPAQGPPGEIAAESAAEASGYRAQFRVTLAGKDLVSESLQKPPSQSSGRESDKERSLREIAAASVASGYRMQFLVAMIADPVESQIPYLFDAALDAIQKGFAEEDYLFDRYWFPWIGEAGKTDHLYRTAPGILLFRQAASRRLAVVFLVGESPKAGIHKRAFQQAMEIAGGLHASSAEMRIDILGPSFSGSLDSLMMALEDWRRVRDSARDRVRNPVSFRIASGSATAMGIKTKFNKLEKDWTKSKGFDGTLSFCRTVVPDHLLQREASRFLGTELEWDLDEAALLAESDTGYGQGLPDFSRRIVNVRFSSGISDLRNAWKSREQDQRPGEGDIKIGDTLLATSREALDLSLKDRDKALDALPRFSPLSTLARDQELSVLLETISRDSIRYVGVLATDLKDRLFVLEKVRRFSPDTILFTFDNDILLGHVDYSEVMDGVLVISSSPLFTEGVSWMPRSHSGKGRERRQFQSESQQGIFEAVRYLLDAPVKSAPQVWVSVVGNGSLWPMAQLPLKEFRKKPEDEYVFCQNADLLPPLDAPFKNLSEEQGGLAGKANLQVIFFAAALCVVSFGLRRAGVLADSRDAAAVSQEEPVSHTLLTLGEAILAISAAVLLVVASIPEWAHLLSGDWIPSAWPWKSRRVLFLAALTIVYIYLCWRIARKAARDKYFFATGALCAVVIVLAPFLLMCVLFDLWMPNGEIAFFQLRARAYSSGLSPIVSLTLLAGAVLVWLVCELRRRWLLKKQNASDCALATFCSREPSLQGCEVRLKRIQELLCRIFPRRERRGEHPLLAPLRRAKELLLRFFQKEHPEKPSLASTPKSGFLPWILPRIQRLQLQIVSQMKQRERHPWLVSVCVLLPPVVLLWDTLQPITETRNYGRLFLAFVAVTAYLAALSLYRFIHIWWNLRRILLRLDHVSRSLAKTFETLAPEIDWKPMRSFGFRIPPFKMMILSASKLKALLKARPLNRVTSEELDKFTSEVFRAEGAGLWRDEVSQRQELERIFNTACEELKQSPGALPAVQEFLAVRIVAYLRYVFAHLRNCLIGAMGTGLLLLLAVSAYAFEPKQFVSFVIWASLAVGAVLTLWIFIQMDRNPTLSRIGNTPVGEVTVDRTLFANLFLYGAIPVLGVIATQFPQVGRVLGHLVDPLLRVTGGG